MPDYSRVLEEVQAWPADVRLMLAENVLQCPRADLRPSQRRGVPAEQVLGIAATNQPAPTDEQTEQWLQEYRQQKYSDEGFVG